MQPPGIFLEATCWATTNIVPLSLASDEIVDHDECHQTTPPTDERENKSGEDTSISPAEVQTASQRAVEKNGGKRRRDSQDNQEDSDDEKNSKHPRTMLSPPLKEDDDTKFACPYRKSNPQKHCVQDWRPCALTPLDTVARAKYVTLLNIHHKH